MDNKFDTRLGYCVLDLPTPEHWDVIGALNVPELILPTRKFKEWAE